MNAGMFTSCIPLKAPRTTAWRPSNTWKNPATINNLEAIDTTSLTSLIFSRLDVSRYKYGSKSLKVKNILDDERQEILNFDSPGRTTMIGIKGEI